MYYYSNLVINNYHENIRYLILNCIILMKNEVSKSQLLS